MRWAVIYEQDPDSGHWAAHTPDLPVFVGGDTRDEVEQLIRDAVTLYLEELRKGGETVPAPRAEAGAIEVAA